MAKKYDLSCELGFLAPLPETWHFEIKRKLKMYAPDDAQCASHVYYTPHTCKFLVKSWCFYVLPAQGSILESDPNKDAIQLLPNWLGKRISVSGSIHNELKRGKSPFWQDNALFTSKAKINIFWKNFEWRVSERGSGMIKSEENVDFNSATTQSVFVWLHDYFKD